MDTTEHASDTAATETLTDEEAKAKESDRVLQEALSRFRLAEDAERGFRTDGLDDLRFRAGDQWDSKSKASRDEDGRPCLVINRLPQFVQQITNDQRQNRPSIKVHPVDDKADVETAKVFQGLVRHIEYNSNADVAYDTAFEGTVTSGFGYIRVVTDYANPMSFDQEILIKRVRNPFAVSLDPYAQEPDGSDANWGFIFDNMSPEEYRKQFPDSELAKNDNWVALGAQEPEWITSDSCRVAEYFYREYRTEKIVLLSTGDVVPVAKLPNPLPEGVTAVRERVAQVPYICWCKINGVEILKKSDWPGRWIPIVPVYGTELYIEGKRILEGIVRNAKDSQRMYNYWSSAETEAIALAPRTPFVGAEGQFSGHEDQWQTANRKNHAFLQYNPISLNGVTLPQPQRQNIEPAVQAITQARMLAGEDLKATTGIYDAALGARSNETSGVAIQRRNNQAQTSNFHLVDNLTRSIRHVGRICIDLIPHIYDAPRAARIIGEDDVHKTVMLNKPFEENGEKRIYQMDVGQYDATVDVGPSFASKRQEAVASMLDVTKAYPALAQYAGDLLVKNMDWPGAQEFADRIKKTLPPGLIDDPTSKEQKVPPQVQAQMQQMGAMLDQLTQALHKAHDQLDQVNQKTLELESKERIEMAKIQADATKMLAQLQSKEGIVLLQQEIAAISRRMALLNVAEPIEDESPHFDPEPAGAPGAMPGMERPPTGGQSPGLPVEGSIQ